MLMLQAGVAQLAQVGQRDRQAVDQHALGHLERDLLGTHVARDARCRARARRSRSAGAARPTRSRASARCDAVGTDFCHAASCRHACSSAQSPSGTMRPDSSATRMKRSRLRPRRARGGPSGTAPRPRASAACAGRRSAGRRGRAAPARSRAAARSRATAATDTSACSAVSNIACCARPCALARYIAMSASRITSSGDSYCGPPIVMPMLTLVDSSARADVHRLAAPRSAAAWRARRRPPRACCARGSRTRRRRAARSRRVGRSCAAMRLPEHHQELVARAVAEAVVDRLEAVAVEEQHGEAEPRVLARSS